MKITQTILVAFVMLAFLGCRTGARSFATKRNFTGLPATDFTVTLSGTPGLKFTGTIATNGVTREVAGTVPATYQIKAHELVCSFKKAEREGSMSLTVSEPGDKEGRSETSAPYGGVRGELLRTPSAKRTLFTDF